ncbi:MAG: ABC transporter permease [Anaerolineales bacterium]|nr:ABC transporter permease [Anaerolineales bacterium]
MSTQVNNPTSTNMIDLLKNIWGWIRKIPPVYPIFLAVAIGVSQLNPNFATVDGIMAFIRRSAPLVILVMGQMFVLASGGFDLSQGSVVTLTIIGSTLIMYNNDEYTYISIAIMLGIGILIGLANGFVVAYLKVPSLIATLGMLLLVKGGGLYWTGGAPKGYLSETYRFIGRGYIENVPILGRFPVSGIVLLVVGTILIVLFHKTNLGKQILAIGDNAQAAKLSGIKVRQIRMIAFVISAITAIIAGILIGGYGGSSIEAGQGMEMQSVSAAVIGGVLLLGGKGSVYDVAFGALTLEAMVSLLNLLGLPKPYRDAVQGLIIIGAVAYAALRTRKRE